MAVAIPYLMFAAAAVGTYAAVKQSQAASATADYNQKVATQNAAVAQQQGLQAQMQQRQDAARKIGLMEANYGANGIDPGSGTATDVINDSISQSTLDNLNIKYNYQLKALGYQNSATLDSSAASNDTTAGYLSAAGSALGGTAGAMKQYYNNGGGVPVTGGQ
jgi:hypothetical protein